MKVRDVMRHHPRATTPGALLSQAGGLMADANCGALPVVGDGEEERVVGVITDRDICLALATRNRKPSEMTVREVMTGDVDSCRPGDELRDALRTMHHRLVRRLPVVDRDGGLVGLLTLDDVLVAACPEVCEDFEREELIDALRAIARREQLQVPV